MAASVARGLGSWSARSGDCCWRVEVCWPMSARALDSDRCAIDEPLCAGDDHMVTEREARDDLSAGTIADTQHHRSLPRLRPVDDEHGWGTVGVEYRK